MNHYGTPDEIRVIFADKDILQLCDETGAETVEDEAVQSVLIGLLEHVTKQMSAYVGVAPSTPTLDSIAAVLAVEGLYGRRSHAEIPKSWQTRIADAKTALKLLSEDKLKTGSGPNATPAIIVSAPEQRFTPEVWKKF